MRIIKCIPNKPVLNGQALPEFGGREGGVADLAPKFGLKSPDRALQAALVQTVGGDDEICRTCRVAHEGAGEYDRRETARALQGENDVCMRNGRDFMNEFRQRPAMLEVGIEMPRLLFLLAGK